MLASTRSLMISAALLGLIAATASGCGRKGDLDKPSTPLADQNKVADPGQGNGQKAKAPDRKFLLDPLL